MGRVKGEDNGNVLLRKKKGEKEKQVFDYLLSC
jgi:hypothetical protein